MFSASAVIRAMTLQTRPLTQFRGSKDFDKLSSTERSELIKEIIVEGYSDVFKVWKDIVKKHSLKKLQQHFEVKTGKKASSAGAEDLYHFVKELYPNLFLTSQVRAKL